MSCDNEDDEENNSPDEYSIVGEWKFNFLILKYVYKTPPYEEIERADDLTEKETQCLLESGTIFTFNDDGTYTFSHSDLNDNLFCQLYEESFGTYTITKNTDGLYELSYTTIKEIDYTNGVSTRYFDENNTNSIKVDFTDSGNKLTIISIDDVCHPIRPEPCEQHLYFEKIK